MTSIGSAASASVASRPARRGFTLLELLIAMAMFAMLGVAVVALLGQGLSLFSEGTASTSIEDRKQSVLPPIRADFVSMEPVSSPEILPPPPPDLPPDKAPEKPTPTPPAISLWSGYFKLSDLPSDWPAVFGVFFVRTNARESEDPILRAAGTTAPAAGVPLRSYDPATRDAGTTTNLLATGGLMEIGYVLVPEDPVPERRVGPVAADTSWSRSVMVLYRLFRAPVGGPKSLLRRENVNSLAKIRAAGRVVCEGVLHFGLTWRNNFARSWTDGVGTGKVADGQPYVGSIWDSTRGADKDFPLTRGADSLSDVRDDVFPRWARIELTLALEGPFGFGRGETVLTEPASANEKRVVVENLDPLYKPAGTPERWLKVGVEWMSTTLDGIDAGDHRVTVGRGKRGTMVVEHPTGEPVFVGESIGTDVELNYKDRYTAAKRR